MALKKVVVLFLLMVFVIRSTFSQCAMCKAVVENGDVSMAEGVNNGISYLMVFPYILIAGLFYTLYRYRKQSKN